MYFTRNKAVELVIWLSWVDDNLIVGSLHIMKDKGKKIVKEIKIDSVGKLKDFVECKIEINKSERSEKFTKPV